MKLNPLALLLGLGLVAGYFVLSRRAEAAAAPAAAAIPGMGTGNGASSGGGSGEVIGGSVGALPALDAALTPAWQAIPFEGYAPAPSKAAPAAPLPEIRPQAQPSAGGGAGPSGGRLYSANNVIP